MSPQKSNHKKGVSLNSFVIRVTVKVGKSDLNVKNLEIRL